MEHSMLFFVSQKNICKKGVPDMEIPFVMRKENTPATYSEPVQESLKNTGDSSKKDARTVRKTRAERRKAAAGKK